MLPGSGSVWSARTSGGDTGHHDALSVRNLERAGVTRIPVGVAPFFLVGEGFDVLDLFRVLQFSGVGLRTEETAPSITIGTTGIACPVDLLQQRKFLTLHWSCDANRGRAHAGRAGGRMSCALCKRRDGSTRWVGGVVLRKPMDMAMSCCATCHLQVDKNSGGNRGGVASPQNSTR